MLGRAQVAVGKLEKLTVFGDDYDTHGTHPLPPPPPQTTHTHTLNTTALVMLCGGRGDLGGGGEACYVSMRTSRYRE